MPPIPSIPYLIDDYYHVGNGLKREVFIFFQFFNKHSNHDVGFGITLQNFACGSFDPGKIENLSRKKIKLIICNYFQKR